MSKTHAGMDRFLLMLCAFVAALLGMAESAVSADLSSSPMTEEAEKQCETTLESDQCPVATLRLCQMAVDTLDNKKSLNHKRLSKALDLLGMCLRHNGKLQEAEVAARRSLRIRQKILGENHDDTAASHETVSIILLEQGKYREAEDGFRRSLNIVIGKHGPNNAQVAMTMNNLSVVLERQSRYGEAEEMNRQAIAIQKMVLGPKHIEVSRSLGNLAVLLMNQGKFDKVEDYILESIEIRKKHYGAEHLMVANSLYGLSQYYQSQGLFFAAEKTSRRVLDIRQRLLPADHFDIAVSLNNIGELLSKQNKYDEALKYVESALLATKNTLGSEHPYAAIYYDNLASIYAYLKRYNLAEENSAMALALHKKQFSGDHLWTARAMHNRAYIFSEQGKTKEAEIMYQESLAMLERLLGSESKITVLCMENLARFYITHSRVDEALRLLHRAVAGTEKQAQAAFSPARLRALLALFRIEEETVYGLLLKPHPSAVNDLAMRLTLRRKGREAEVGALNNRLVHLSLGRREMKQRFDEWSAVRQQRENLLFAGGGRLPAEQYREQLHDLEQLATDLEHRLAVDVPDLRSLQPPPLHVILEDVTQRLPQHGVLVDVVWTKPWLGEAQPQRSEWGKAHYVALLLYPDQRIVSVDLGLAAELDEKGRELLAALRTPQSDPKSAAQAMYLKLFAPLLPHLAGKKEVYLSLDGSLHLIPFAALHDGSDYLLGKYHFHYLTSGRDLLREPSKRSPSAALVLANPDFGPIEPATTPAQSAPTMSIYQRLATLTALPAAQVEAEQIAALLGVKPLLGSAAREEVIHDAHAPWILHLATHGLFLGDVELPVFDERTRSSLLALVPAPAPQPATPNTEQLPGEINAMNRSTLVLAGVRQGQRASSLNQDGLLTAENSRSLDLDGTQLVVLSACDSGVGTTSNGQGIYGLRRGFLVAGAETVVTSLWRVDDQATGELMVLYYRKLLDPKNPGDRLRAMEESMQELRSRRAHPYYWAPFLVIGQDGPLRRP